MKKILFIVIFLTATPCLFGQKILLEEDIKNDYTELLNGRDRSSFGHWFLEYGFIVGKPEGEGIDAKRNTSHTFATGYRYRYKIANFYAMGFELNYTYMTYHLKQTESKTIPTADLHKKEAFILNNFGVEYFNRINFGERGERIGHYIDVGLYLNWAFRIKHYTKDKNDNNEPNAKIIEVIHTNLNYTQPINYGAKARLGFNRYSVSVSYRTTDLFNERFDAELPRFIVGLQIGLHK